jgi:hypothetical protein
MGGVRLRFTRVAFGEPGNSRPRVCRWQVAVQSKEELKMNSPELGGILRGAPTCAKASVRRQDDGRSILCHDHLGLHHIVHGIADSSDAVT